MKLRAVYVNRVDRFSLEIDDETGRTFVGIPVRNTHVEYDEWYEVDRDTFARFQLDPTLARDFAVRAKRRELDHLLLLPPGPDRGVPD